MAGDVDRAAARGGKEGAERALGDAKGDRLQAPRPERVAERAAQMAGTDWLDMANDEPGKGEARLRIGGAEWGQRVEMVDQPADRAFRRERTVDREFRPEALAVPPVAEP